MSKAKTKQDVKDRDSRSNEGTGAARVGVKQCSACEGEGEICSACKHTLDACECPDGYTGEVCEKCDGTGEV